MFSHERRQGKSRTREEKTRGGQDPVTEPDHRVQGRGQSVCPELVSERTREGQQQDKRRTTGGQKPATEPGHRVRGRGQDKNNRTATEPASECGQLFFKIEPQQ